MTRLAKSVLLTPVDLSVATRIGPRLYRKQLLRKVGIDYPTPDGKKQRVEFDDAYLNELAESFGAGAYDLAPFILADEANRHTLDPKRYEGELKAVEVTPDGLDGILELTPDAAELVERTGRRLGVSARIKQAVEHVDGRKFGRAIHHVLGTLDGRMQGPTHGLSPWQPIDLADDDPETVLDLSSLRYPGDTMARRSLDHLTDDDYAALEALVSDNGISLSSPDDEGDGTGEGDGTADAPGGDEGAEGAEGEGDGTGEGDGSDAGEGEGDDGAGDEGDGITDAELDALIDAELESMGITPPAGAAPGGDDTSLSAADDGADEGDDLDLTATLEVDETARLRAELARREYVAAGVPPYAVDLCVAVLGLPADDDTLDLASPVDGSPMDVRTIVTSLLDALKGTVDLSAEAGYGHDTGGTAQLTEVESAWLKHMQAEGLTT